MSQHLENFAKQHIGNKSIGYLLALWIIHTKRLERGRLSEKIKESLVTYGLDILKINIQRRSRKYSAFIKKAGDLNFPSQNSLKSLGAMRIRNFRGFGSFGVDDKGTYVKFAPGKNIFYAPNGGGKTSLCEAIEFVVTGSLKEADRRSTKIADYIRREQTKHEILFKASDGSQFQSNALWSPCFIDRNRLQEFSLLGSKDTNFHQKDVLAALFGLEEIEEVIQRFVQPRSFNLKNLEICAATQEKARVMEDQQRSIQRKQELLTEINTYKRKLCSILEISHYSSFLVQTRFNFLNKLLVYREEKLKGRQSELAPGFVPPRRLDAFIRSLRLAMSRYARVQDHLADNIGMVNFEAFFSLLTTLALDEENLHTCPACLTPIDQVHENPYIRAQRELEKLKDISALKDALSAAEKAIVRCEQLCQKFLSAITENQDRGISLNFYVSPPGEIFAGIQKNQTETFSLRVSNLRALYGWLTDNEVQLQLYNEDARQKYEKRQAANNQISAMRKKIEQLRENMNEVKTIFKSIKFNRGEIQKIGLRINNMSTQQKSLLVSVSKEQRYNALLAEVQGEYANLYNDLLSYKLAMEEVQIQGIEAKAAEYYRAINKHDDDSEKIRELKFERAATGYRIKIALTHGGVTDAFSALSEGHIRSLGLALLLAVAEKYQYPFIVFDDVVNAIDSDHRANIINLMFNDAYLKHTQQIITTHDRLFWERYCNMCKAKHVTETFSSRVLRHTNKGIVVVDYDAGFPAKIELALSVSDIRQALIYCRIWVETIVVKYCVTNKVKLTAVFSPNNLRPENLLEINLELMYKLINPALAWDTSNIDVIKRDLINWKGQNQEHHAFDENSFNFVHSKTSPEIQRIYEATKRLEHQLFPNDIKSALQADRAMLFERLTHAERKLADQGFVANAKPDVVDEFEQRKVNCKAGIDRIDQDLLYVEVCLANVYVHPAADTENAQLS
jgi:DNA sulfur modification protein DndD